jgi:hypothetical protein
VLLLDQPLSTACTQDEWVHCQQLWTEVHIPTAPAALELQHAAISRRGAPSQRAQVVR